MYRSFDYGEGEPCRLYRRPEEIRRDIEDVNARINGIHNRFNIRSLLGDMLAVCTDESERPERCIGELEELVSEARSSVDELTQLRDMLFALSCELEDTRCAMGL